MKKTLIALALASASSISFAETLGQSGNLPSVCEFSDTSSGTLVASGTSVTTGVAASTTLTNNDPAVYEVTIGAVSVSTPTTFTTAGGVVSSADTDIQFDANGPNPSVFPMSTDVGNVESLATDGADDITSSIFATLSRAATAGDYAGTVDITCSASESEGGALEGGFEP